MPVLGIFYGAILGLFLAAGSASAAPITIKFSHDEGENTPKGQGAQLFKQLVEERLPGRVTVTVYPNSQLFSAANELHALLLGDVQMLAPSLSNLEQFNPQSQVFELPFLFDDIDAVHRFQTSPSGKSILGTMIRNGYRGLTYWDNGMKVFTATLPLRLPMDAHDLTFAIEPSRVTEADIEAVGAIPLTIAPSELYEALKTGKAEGTENPWSRIYANKLFEHQPYITATNHSYLGYMVITSSKFWEELPAEIRQTLISIIDEVSVEVNRLAKELADSDRQKVIASGVSEEISLTPDERAKWVTAMQPVVDRFATNIGPEVVNAARSANSKQ